MCVNTYMQGHAHRQYRTVLYQVVRKRKTWYMCISVSQRCFSLGYFFLAKNSTFSDNILQKKIIFFILI